MKNLDEYQKRLEEEFIVGGDCLKLIWGWMKQDVISLKYFKKLIEIWENLK
jgi:hypothetical protein